MISKQPKILKSFAFRVTMHVTPALKYDAASIVSRRRLRPSRYWLIYSKNNFVLATVGKTSVDSLAVRQYSARFSASDIVKGVGNRLGSATVWRNSDDTTGKSARPTNEERESLINDTTQHALERSDETLRELALRRYREFEQELGPLLVRFTIDETIAWLRRVGDLKDINESETGPGADAARFAEQLAPRFGRWLARSQSIACNPSLEDVQELTQAIARELQAQGALTDVVEALQIKDSLPAALWHQSLEALGAEHRTFAGEMLKAIIAQRLKLWRERAALVNYELFDQAAPAFNWYVLEELAKAAQAKGLTKDVAHGEETEQFAERAIAAQLGRDVELAARLLAFPPKNTGEPPVLRNSFLALREELDLPC